MLYSVVDIVLCHSSGYSSDSYKSFPVRGTEWILCFLTSTEKKKFLNRLILLALKSKKKASHKHLSSTSSVPCPCYLTWVHKSLDTLQWFLHFFQACLCEATGFLFTNHTISYLLTIHENMQHACIWCCVHRTRLRLVYLRYSREQFVNREYRAIFMSSFSHFESIVFAVYNFFLLFLFFFFYFRIWM